MKKTQWLMAAALILTMGSCGNSGKQQAAKDTASDQEREMEIPVMNRDSTIYGICGDGSAMNTLQLLTDNGDTLNLSVTEASEKGKCFGGFQSGDRMAVMLGDQHSAKLVINLSALLGNWVMPNPLDGSSEVGFRIKDGGIIEGIEQSSLIYKTWKIFNGRLEILTVREGGGEEEEITVYDMVGLGADSLIIKDSEDTFEYSRQKVDEVKSKIKLEDASKESFQL